MDSCRYLKRNAEIVIPPGYEHLVEPAQYELVEKTWREWNTAAREFLRSETGLKLSVGGKQHNVQITARNYIPREFDAVIRQLGMENWLLVQKRPLLLRLHRDTVSLKEYFDRNPNAKTQLGLGQGDIDSAKQYESMIRSIIDKLPHWQMEVFGKFRQINEDVLGAYFPSGSYVELYWIPIVLIAQSLDVSIEELTLVVLIHELAHAYTHVGMDIGGAHWDKDKFVATDRAILEGLAQYYTELFLTKIASDIPRAIEAFNLLLDMQASDYHTHRNWIDWNHPAQSEAVRLALLDARINRLDLHQFSSDVAENKSRLWRP